MRVAFLGILSVLLAGQVQAPLHSHALTVYALGGHVAANKVEPQSVNWSVSICNYGPAGVGTIEAVDSRSSGARYTLVPSNVDLDTGQCARVAVRADTLAAGQLHAAEIRLRRADGKDARAIGQVAFSRRAASMAKTLEHVSLADGNAVLQSANDSEPRVRIVNGFENAVLVSWHLEGGDVHGAGVVELAPKSTQSVPLRIVRSGKSLHGATDANLVLMPATEPESRLAISQKAFAIAIPAARKSDWRREGLTTAMLLSLLLVGAFLSFLCFTLLPNWLTKRDLRRRLDEVRRELRESRPCSDVDTHVACQREVQRVRGELKRLTLIGSDLNARLPDLQQALSLLEARVKLANETGSLLSSLRAPAGNGLGLLANSHIRQKCSEASVLLQNMDFSEEDRLAAHEALSEAAHVAGAAGREQSTVLSLIKTREASLVSAIVALEGAPAPGEGGLWMELTRQLDGYSGARADLGRSEFFPGEYVKRELRLLALELVLRLHKCRSGIKKDAEATFLLKLRQCLEDLSWTTVASVSRDFEHLHDGVAPAAVEERAATSEFTIVASRNPVRPYEPVSFTLWFDDDALNYSSVRENWRCGWMLQSGSSMVAVDGQWKVWFSAPNDIAEHIASVTHLVTDSGKKIVLQRAPTLKLAVVQRVMPAVGHGTRVELTKTVIVQSIPLFAMLTQGRDLLSAADPISAALVVVASGFGVNTAKNVVASGFTAVANAVAQKASVAPAPPVQVAGVKADSALTKMAQLK